MKTKLLFISILLFSINLSFSQVMSWDDGTIKVPKSENADGKFQNLVDYGSFSSFSIQDINLFLWKVTISGNRVDLDTPVPTELQALFRLPSKQLEATANSTEASGTADKISEQIEKIEKVTSLSVDLAAAKTDELKQELENFRKKTIDYSTQAKILTNNIQSTKQDRINFINLAQRDLSYKEMSLEVDNHFVTRTLSIDLQTMIEKYKLVQESYDKVITIIDAGSGDKSTIEKIMLDLKAGFKTMENEFPAIYVVYGDVTFLAGELKNKKNFTAIAPPVQADGDFVNYKVDIVPTQTNILGAHKSPKSFDFDIPVRGGWKTDFSVGPTFSFGTDAKDEKYFLEQGSTENNVIIKKRPNNNVLSPGLAAMMHFYKRSGKDFSWGGMLGVGAGFQTVEDVDVSFYSGLSFILGKKQKIMISAGISFLKVERLKEEEYKTDTEYLAGEFTINNVTEKVIKGSFFLSLSYNLTNRSER